MINFNLNDEVRIKLTDVGRAHMRKSIDSLKAGVLQTIYAGSEDEDANGWSKWQLWRVMQEFGDILCNGCPPPFEMNMELLGSPLGTPLTGTVETQVGDFQFIYQIAHTNEHGVTAWMDISKESYDTWNKERQGGAFTSGATRKVEVIEHLNAENLKAQDSDARLPTVWFKPRVLQAIEEISSQSQSSIAHTTISRILNSLAGLPDARGDTEWTDLATEQPARLKAIVLHEVYLLRKLRDGRNCAILDKGWCEALDALRASLDTDLLTADAPMKSSQSDWVDLSAERLLSKQPDSAEAFDWDEEVKPLYAALHAFNTRRQMHRLRSKK